MHSIENEALIQAPADALYRALSTPEGIRGWWAVDSDVSAEVGGAHELRFVKGDRQVTMRFRLDELTPGERVVWTCTENGNPVWPGTRLTWTLAPAEGGTRVRFSHSGFREDRSPPFQMTAQGWQHFHASLRAYAETGAGQPW